MSGGCRRQKKNVSLYVAGLLSAPAGNAMEAHLKSCRPCSQYAQELTELAQAIPRLRDDGSEIAPSENFHARWTAEVLGSASTPRQYRSRLADWFADNRWTVGWGIAVSVCVVMLAVIFHRKAESKRASVPNVLENAEFLRQTLAMFPNRVRAIMRDERGLRLVLSDVEEIPASTPCYLRVCDGRHCLSVVTFSGQDIQLDGQKISVLADPRGKMILIGKNLLWSDTDRIYPNSGWNIEARNLGRIGVNG
jgi:hypothetical protein